MDLESIKNQLESYRMDEFLDTFFSKDDTNIREISKLVPKHPLEFDEKVIYAALHRVINRFDMIVNQGLLKELAKTMNVLEKDENRFHFKTEFVYKALYFVVKKVYGEFAIFREGVPVYDIGVKRIGIRSDVPDMSNTMLLDLIRTIFLVRGNVNLVLKRVNYWKNRFLQKIQERSIDILVPCGMSKDVDEYKNKNDCIRGMLIYNALTGTEEFTTNTRGFKVYVSGFNYGKLGIDPKHIPNIMKELCNKYGFKYDLKKLLNVIVIPITSKKVPDWIQIDVPTTMEKIFYGRVNELLQGFGITVGEKQKFTIDDIF